MAGHGVLVQRGQELTLLPQKAAQHRVHQAAGGLGAALGGLHGLVDQGVGVVFGAAGQGQGRGQQGVDPGRRGLGHQALAQGLGGAQTAQHGEGQGLHAGAFGGGALGQDVGERLALANGGHGVGTAAEQLPEGQAVAGRVDRRGGGRRARRCVHGAQSMR